MTMKLTTSTDIRRSTLLAIGLLAGMGVSLGILSPVMANPNTPQPLQDFQNPDKSSDPFSSRGGQSGVMDFIHRAMQGGGRSIDEFSADQGENLDSAMTEFRKQQQAELRKRRQAQSETTTPIPGATPEGSEGTSSVTP
ncbi:hypothetical protein ACN4EK_12065 [Pantanalinema rosaneae CENA516]|uniref:hypothetical protein n=1 Tax=Pantanalinema rosaneae TaxID=1620701 RepID=UPI003D6DB88D